MKYLLFILLFVSCTGNCPHSNPTTPKRQYVEEICPKCKGTGCRNEYGPESWISHLYVRDGLTM